MCCGTAVSDNSPVDFTAQVQQGECSSADDIFSCIFYHEYLVSYDIF